MIPLPLDAWAFWLGLALVLLVVEIFTSGYFALGFAVAALLVIVLQLLGAPADAWILPIWAGLGVVFWYGLARTFRRLRGTQPDINAFDSREGLPSADRTANGQRWQTPTESYDTNSNKHRGEFPRKDE